jgi:hypothetical protein
MNGQGFVWMGLTASILVALAGQADFMPEPWRHWLVIGGIVGTAINGYLIERVRPWDRRTERRNGDNPST